MQLATLIARLGRWADYYNEKSAKLKFSSRQAALAYRDTSAQLVDLQLALANFSKSIEQASEDFPEEYNTEPPKDVVQKIEED